MKKRSILFVFIFIIQFSTQAQTDTIPSNSKPLITKDWLNNISLGGYVQARYNRLLETNPDLGCDQCDGTWGEGGGFSLRRVRLKFSGNIGKYVYFYIQPDFASSGSGSGVNYGQLRDAYFDVSLDEKREYRFRIGQSKVPFGFENMQSSQNRIPLDRNDGLNSAIKNEREMGVFFYWAPQKIRKLYSQLSNSQLKGSGDYGAFAFGIFNGQTGNMPESNNVLHVVSRFTYPFKIGNQIIEPGIQAYTGKYQILEHNISEGTLLENEDRNYIDQRIGTSFILYPQPFGIQAEYNIGRGPEFNTENNTIETTFLHGGYATLSYRTNFFDQTFIPFTRYQYYDGGKKFEQDARSYDVSDLEIGIEWQPFRSFELVAMYTISSRRYEDFNKPINQQDGSLLRLQAQVNF